MAEMLTYEEKVIDTFRKTALRTVLMIDDQFPTFSDLARARKCESGEGQCGFSALETKFTERERALRLYEMFRSYDMPCDIENAPDVDAGEDVERIRKSDLVVIDYNLDGADDNRKSIRLLTKLAETSHFNTIVLYTNEPDLDSVWFDVAHSLKGGWLRPDELLNGEALDTWDRLSDEDAPLPQPSKELVKRHLTAGRKGWGDERHSIEKELIELDVPRKQCTEIIEALIHRKALVRLGDRAADCANKPSWLSGRCETEKPIWLQAGNCFIAIMGKSRPSADGPPEDNDDIIGYLDKALKDWRPNLLQIVISEIQNILELNALATDEMHLQNPEMQAGLFYHLLQMASGLPLSDDGASYAPAIENIIDRLVENVRQKISSNSAVVTNAARLLRDELKTAGKWPLHSRADASEMFRLAVRMTGSPLAPNQQETVFKLNVFLSSEEFRRGSLTTGTVVRLRDSEEYWIFMSPACDMVPREPHESQFWTKALFPLRAFACVKLKKNDRVGSALKDAEKGHSIFLEIDGRSAAFSLLDANTRQPSYEILFPTNEGRIDADSMAARFEAFRILPARGGEASVSREMAPYQFEVVGQLRHQYANRFLQIVGNYTSRIGVDFVKLP